MNLIHKLATCLGGKTALHRGQGKSQACFCVWCAKGVKTVLMQPPKMQSMKDDLANETLIRRNFLLPTCHPKPLNKRDL